MTARRHGLAAPGPQPGGAYARRGREGSSLTGRTLAGLEWAGLTAAVQALLSLAILAALSRLLTPADFGLTALAMVFVAAAQWIGPRNIGSAIVRHPGLADRHLATGMVLSGAAGILLAAGVWGLAPAAARLTGEPAVAPLLETLSLALAVSGLATVPEALCRRQLRFRALSAVEVSAQIFGYGVVAIVLAATGFGVQALVWGIVLRRAVHAAAVFATAPRLPRPGLAWRPASELLHAGVGFSSIALFSLAARQGSRLVIGSWLGAAALGHYTPAMALASLFGYPGRVLGGVLFPAMAERQDRVDRLVPVWLNGTEMLALLALPFGLMLAVSAPEIVAVVLGGQWDAAVPAVRILAAGAAARICGLVNRPVPRAMGALGRVAWRQAAFACLLLPAVAAGSRWGLDGAAAAASGALLVFWLMMTQLSLSLLGLDRRAWLQRLLPALWTGAWAAPALALTAMLAREADLPAAAALAAQAAACAAAAGAAVWHAPRCARARFPVWALAQWPPGAMGRPGRLLRWALACLARRNGR